jgi:hypothetical protein
VEAGALQPARKLAIKSRVKNFPNVFIPSSSIFDQETNKLETQQSSPQQVFPLASFQRNTLFEESLPPFTSKSILPG